MSWDNGNPRIAFYAPLRSPDDPTPSGERRMAELVMAALRAAGHAPFLASRFRSYEGRGDAAAQATLRDAGAREAASVLGALRADPPRAWVTYHLYYKAPDWIGPPVAAALGIPYVAVEASHAAKRAGGPFDLGHRSVAAALGQAGAVLHLTRRDRAGLAPLVAADRLFHLPPFVDPTPFAAALRARAEHRAALAATHGLEPDLPWLLTVAMMRPRDKLASYRVLATALARLDARPWRLLVAGDGPARADVMAALAPLGARVRLLGRQDAAALPGLYAAADLFLWPAVNEAFGLVFLEAQAAGVPVVAGDSGGAADTLLPGATGLLAPEGDADAFAQAVARLLDDPASRHAMGRRAADFIAAERDLTHAGAVLARALRRAVQP